MRNILRLSLTLAVVGIISALLLTVVNSWTNPIIAERQLQDYLESVRGYFPDVAEYEEKEHEGNYYDLIYDGSGALIGVIGKNLEYKGYGGIVQYTLAIDQSGKIVGYQIVNHSETPGLGDVITKPEFQDRFIGRTVEELDSVDTVSGATISTSAIIGAIRSISAIAAVTFLGVEEEFFDISAVPDGTHTGKGMGLMGEIKVEVTVEGGKITTIKVLENSETPTYFVQSYPEIPNRIIAEQKLEVDTQTGATESAGGIIAAVRNALEKAMEDGGDSSE